LLSPVPLSKLGVAFSPELVRDALGRRPYPELRDFGFFNPLSTLLCFDESLLLLVVVCIGGGSLGDVVDAESGLGGRLVTRTELLGGRGKEPMLVVLRTVFGMPVLPIVGTGTSEEYGLLSVGIEGVEFVFVGRGVGTPVEVNERLGIEDFFGVVEGICDECREPPLARLSFEARRFLPTGRAGRGPVGGGRGVRGRVEVTVEAIFVRGRLKRAWLRGWMRSPATARQTGYCAGGVCNVEHG
jgi:hypothetical protein